MIVRRNQKVLQSMVVIALFTAVFAVLSPWAIPVGSVPVTLALLGVYFIGGMLGAVRGTTVVVLYLGLGAVGVPIFAGFVGGIWHFLTPTGGFLVGYIPCVLFAGFSKKCRKTWLRAVFMTAGTIVMYLIGWIWFYAVSGVPFWSALLVSVLPFLPFDALKLGVALWLMPLLEKPFAQLDV